MGYGGRVVTRRGGCGNRVGTGRGYPGLVTRQLRLRWVQPCPGTLEGCDISYFSNDSSKRTGSGRCPSSRSLPRVSSCRAAPACLGVSAGRRLKLFQAPPQPQSACCLSISPPSDIYHLRILMEKTRALIVTYEYVGSSSRSAC